MFDPTVFENLKVAFENQLYDLDNLDGIIRITNRMDRMEMSVMAREFALQFQLTDDTAITAEIRLMASLQDLAAEILETPGMKPGCTLRLYFYLDVATPSLCEEIEGIMKQHWPELSPLQTISYGYGDEPRAYQIEAKLEFNRKINEDQMEDIPELIEHVLGTVRALQESLR